MHLRELRLFNLLILAVLFIHLSACRPSSGEPGKDGESAADNWPAEADPAARINPDTIDVGFREPPLDSASRDTTR